MCESGVWLCMVWVAVYGSVVYVFINVHQCLSLCVCLWEDVWVYMCIYVCLCVCVSVCVHVCQCLSVYVCVRAHAHMRACVFILSGLDS